MKRTRLQGEWSIREFDQQISTCAYERRVRNSKVTGEAALGPDEHVRDPFVLEFLKLKDECSESDLEDDLIYGLEAFSLELGRTGSG